MFMWATPPLEMGTDKYSLDITILYPYPQRKMAPSGQPYPLMDINLLSYPYPCGYGSSIWSPIPTKIKHTTPKTYTSYGFLTSYNLYNKP
jgi:hypothetical protein